MPIRNKTRRSLQALGARARNINRARDRSGMSYNPQHVPAPVSGGPRDSAPWLRKMGHAAGFTSGRDSSAERRIRRMIANAIQIETARLAAGGTPA
jgi:hypothetical protein